VNEPDAGDLSVFSGETTRLIREAEAFGAAITTTATISAFVSADWVGDAADAVVDELASLTPEFDQLRTWLEGDAAAHTAYGAEVSAIKDLASALRAQRDDLAQQLESAHRRADDADDELDRARLGGDPTTLHEQQVRRTGAHQHVTSLEQSLDLNSRSLDALDERRTAADEAFIAALEAAVPAGLLPSGGFGASLFSSSLLPTSSSLLGSSDPSGPELLEFLATMTPATLAIWLEDHPGALDWLQSNPPPAVDVATWWLGLNPGARPGAINAVQRTLLEGVPDAFGNLDGISYAGRDIANRIRLQNYLDDPSTSETALANKAAAEALLAALEAGPDDPVHQLISFHPGTPPRTAYDDGTPPLGAVSVGDLDNAMYVNYMVSGMGTTTAGDAVGWTNQAEWMYDEERRLADRAGLTGDIATISWLGYEAPPIPVQQALDFGVLGGAYAQAGGDNLARDLQGLLATRASTGNDPFLSVTGHSYGTTTAANALTQVNVDSFTMLASAGIEDDISRSDLLVPRNEVYSAIANEKAPWAYLGQFGSGRQDPSGLDDVNVWYPDATVIDGEHYSATNVHETYLPGADTGYLEKGTTALHNTALAALGQGDQITPTFDQPTPRPTPGPSPTPPPGG
jgi:hypothetical protein